MGRRGGNKQGKGKGKGKGRQAGERGGGAGEEESSRSDSRLNPKYGAEREWRCDNLLFSLFYQALGLVDASEWDGLVAAMSRDLPASFRVNSLCTHAKQVKEDLMTLDETMIEVDGKKVAAGKCIEWYPDQMAYKLIVDKRKMKKLPELAEYTKVVQLHTESGAISRLEEVSMVPPRFLDVRSGMTVLDMCASPGSKTFQLIEMLMASEREEEGKVCHSRSIVVANDVNKDRCYLLSHQLKRLSYPGLCVTCCPGQNFPNISLPGSGEAPHDDSSDSGFFDRVLCDVPCSGDGTIRKLPDVWHKWDTKNSIGVHSLQVDITLRGLEVTKVGGLLVYSTCSLSPYENEAVVAELLRRQKGSVELVDVSSLYPLLKRRPGKASWKVIPITREDRSKYVRNEETDMQLVEDPLQALKDIGIPVYSAISEVPSDATMQLSASLFPPSEQESAAMHLDRCMRFVHSDQDTGGFFVAVLRKTGSIKSRVMPKATENAKPPPKKKTKSRGGGNNPATQLVHVEAGVTDLLKEKFGLLDSFSMDNLVSHHTGARGMWFCNDTVTAAIINSEASKTLDVVQAGIKVFDMESRGRRSSDPGGRLTYEGLAAIRPFITQRIFRCTGADMSIICTISGGYAAFDRFSSDMISAMEGFSVGCAVVECPGPDDEDEPLLALIWKEKSISPLIHKSFLYGIECTLRMRGQFVQPDPLPVRKVAAGEQTEPSIVEGEQEPDQGL